MTEAVTGYDGKDGRSLMRGIGVPGRVAVMWAAAGGVLVGGFLVAAMTLMGRLSGHSLLLTSTGLFVVGAALGYVHGAVLGWLGRPKGVTRREAMGGLALSLAYAVPALLVSWLVAGWVGMTSVALYSGSVAALAGCGAAWLVGLVLIALATERGWAALRTASAGWSNARVATLLVAAVFGGLLTVFLAERPELWGVSLRVTPVGAVLLAAFATIWLAGPMITIALGLIERLPASARPAMAFGGRGRAIVSGLLAVVVGVVVALIALPFYQVAGLGGGAVAAAVTTAFVDEVLLRLFLMTAVVWLLLREFDMGAGRAAALAITVTAAVQGLIYLPSALAFGFPTLTATLGFLAVTALIPAVAFGLLFWRRGFGTAVLAHVTAIAALFLIVGG